MRDYVLIETIGQCRIIEGKPEIITDVYVYYTDSMGENQVYKLFNASISSVTLSSTGVLTWRDTLGSRRTVWL